MISCQYWILFATSVQSSCGFKHHRTNFLDTVGDLQETRDILYCYFCYKLSSAVRLFLRLFREVLVRTVPLVSVKLKTVFILPRIYVVVLSFGSVVTIVSTEMIKSGHSLLFCFNCCSSILILFNTSATEKVGTELMFLTLTFLGPTRVFFMYHGPVMLRPGVWVWFRLYEELLLFFLTLTLAPDVCALTYLAGIANHVQVLLITYSCQEQFCTKIQLTGVYQ